MSLLITYYILLFLTVSQVPQVRSVFFFYDKNLKINKSESYTIWFDNLEIKQSESKRYLRPPSLGKNLASYRNVSHHYTADQRCEIGLPLSVAIFQLSPYVSNTLAIKAVPARNVTINGTTRTIPFHMKTGFTFFGVFPEILKKALPTCCHTGSDIRFGKILFEQYVPAEMDQANEYDFSFPLYGDSMEATMYRSNNFIPIIQAPSVSLIVRSDGGKIGKTNIIAKTIIRAWPMFVFILLIAGVSGVVMRCLDRSKTDDRKPFMKEVFEGFWWSFITMTTVGYGDRIPRSYLARFFCILWIIFSIVIISILSGLITTALSETTKINFNLHGAKIGAVSGSEEFRFGLSLNADMQAFGTSAKAFAALQYHRNISGILIDNYVAGSFDKKIIEYNLRVDRKMNHGITYGIRMAKGSERLEKCIRSYLRDYPQEVFDMFSKSLNVVKNPKDRVNLQEEEAKKLFYQDEIMELMLKYGAIFVASLLVFGVFVQLIIYCVPKIIEKRKARLSSKFTHRVVSDMKWGLGSMQEVDSPMKELLDQYNCFQDGWVKKMKAIHQE